MNHRPRRPGPEELRELLLAVARTQPEELDCDALLARVGAYLEHLPRGGELPPDLQRVAQHLSVCPQCREEFEALLDL